MSIRKVEVEQRICEWCDKPMDGPVKDVVVFLDSPVCDLKAGIIVRVEAEKNGIDLHERCQIAAIGKAAHIVGAVKTRGRAAQRVGDQPGGVQIQPPAPADTKMPGDQSGVPDFGGDTRVETHSEPEFAPKASGS